jgi:dolichol-phosphate mannosyltransferase
MPKTFVTIPTYNEAENIEALLKEILSLGISDLYTVVIDDNSPDGTAKIAQNLAEENPGVKVLLRDKNRGRGLAGIAGFKFALEQGADYIIEMDADFSHNPKYLPALLKNIQNNDIVLGSRFVKGGKDVDRGPLRKATTFLARIYIRLMLGIKVRDITSGYRCFRRKALEKIGLDSLISTGPSIVSEILYRASLKGLKIQEIPIIFEDRKTGQTKLNLLILLKTLLMVYHFKRTAKKQT